MNHLMREISVKLDFHRAGKTSELLELVSVPTAPCLSMSTVLVPTLAASCLAIARPTAPPPTI